MNNLKKGSCCDMIKERRGKNMKKKWTKTEIKLYIKNILLILLGTFVLACGTEIFLAQSRLVTGGMSGIAIVLDEIIPWDFLNFNVIMAILTWTFFILGLSAFKKGWIYIINYFILFLGFVFLFIDFYLDREYDRIKKIHCYIFIVSGAIMWVIGILKFINQGFLSKDIFLLGQTD